MQTLSRLHPELHLSVIHSSEQHPSLDALHRETADILILPSTLLDEHYLEHLHWADRYVLVVAKNKSTGTFNQLADTMRYVSWRHAGVERLHSQLASAPIRLSHRGELSCVQTLLELVGKGHCLSILPSALLPTHHHDFDYLPLPLNVERRLSVIARPVSLLSDAANAVIAALKQSTQPTSRRPG
jgi:hypothetical protein